MRASSFGYLVRQGAKNVIINRLMSFACVGVMMACLMIIGAAVLLAQNVSSMLGYVEEQNEIVAFVEEGVSETRCEALAGELSDVDNVASVQYISKAEALAGERERLGEDAALLDGLDEDNPYPASYRIVLRDLDHIEQTVDTLERFPELMSIDAPLELSRTISAMQRILFYAGAAIVGVLVIVSLIIISNTVKLTIFSHRREINIMKYCGATDTYIRLPFLVEGTIVGLVAAGLSYGIVYGVYQYILYWLTSSKAETGFLQSLVDRAIPFSTLALPMGLLFLAFGVLVGLLGSTFFVRKYLKV